MIRDPMQALERDLQAERASALARIDDLFLKALEAWEAAESGQLAPHRQAPRQSGSGGSSSATSPRSDSGCCWCSASRSGS